MSTYADWKCSQLNENRDDRKCTCCTNEGSCCGCSPKICLPSVLNLISSQQNDDRMAAIEAIRNNIHCGANVALVLGAGVSVPAGLPNWYGLISKMLGYSIQYEFMKERNRSLPKDYINRVSTLTNAMIDGSIESLRSTDTLESGEYIAQQFADPNAPAKVQQQFPGISMQIMLERMLRKAKMPLQLLEGMCKEGKGIFSPEMSKDVVDKVTGWWNSFQKEKPIFNQLEHLFATLPQKKEDIIKIIAKENTIAAISYLLSSNNNIRKVMTYNYDPMVEVYTQEFFGNNILCMTGENGCPAYPSGNNLEIFHVHGFVPGWIKDEFSHLQLPNTSKNIILSEDSYYDIERSGIYDWSSRTQACFLSDWSCIFVGFSASDYNFKRILRQMGRRRKSGYSEKCKHYLIFTIDEIAKTTYQDICKYYISRKIHADAAQIQMDTLLLLERILECKRKYWERFSIEPIWITIPEISALLVNLIDP